MKHLKVFKNKEDYQLYKYSYLYKKPNISSIIDSYEILYDLFLFNSNNYLTISSLEDGLTVKLSKNSCQYSLDGMSWIDLPANTETPAINIGKKIYFKGNLTPRSSYGIGTFTISKKFNLSGNVMSMLFGNDAEDKTDLTGYNNAFLGLFQNCTTLQSVSNEFLPATKLADSCYEGMFQGCTSLTKMPELPATTLAGYCYSGMFRGCTSLTRMPELPATTLVEGCYAQMFYGCSKLNYIKAMFTTIPSQYYTTYWTYGVSSTGTFVKNDNASWNNIGVNGVPNGWVIKTKSEELNILLKNILTIEALEDGLTVKLSKNSCQYSLDGMSWIDLPANTETPAINIGKKIYFKGNLTPRSSYGIGTFTISKKCNLSGKVMSMLFGDNAEDKTDLTGYNNAFSGLFQNCTTLQSVSNEFLPATTLSNSCYAFMFNGCTSLKTAPELSATTLADSCYEGMFQGCTSLTNMPELPATTLVDFCYYNMFQNCTSLTTTPSILPAKTLASRCYQYMFQGCTNLTKAPELPATTLSNSCYEGMFARCTSLTNMPELSATTLADSCYAYMFQGCISLFKTMSELPATTLANSCYKYMFSECTSLTTAPVLPATILKYYCYDYMFSNCSKLNYIKAMFTTTPSQYYTTYWTYGVSSTGTFVKNDNASWNNIGVNGVPNGWVIVNETSEKFLNYCIIEALEDGLTVSFSQNSLLYSIDYGKNWNILSVGSTTPPINVGDMIIFKQTNLTPSDNGIGTFSVNKKFNLKGSVMSLLFGDNPSVNSLKGYDYAFSQLFYNCTTLQSVSSGFLPATTLANYCYSGMFQDCTSLVTAPELPATTLSDYCYSGMFDRCTSLTTAPELPATTLADSCYGKMFAGCTSLVTAPELPAITLSDGCYESMFNRCTSLTTAPELPATNLADNCYNYMFSECTSLITTFILPATTLFDHCYSYMFSGCYSLKFVYNLPATTLANYCYSGMFQDCTSLVTAPELPATTLADSCYDSMFYGCTSLNYIKALFIRTSDSYTSNWVYGVSPTGIFVQHPEAILVEGVNGIPTGWEVRENINNSYCIIEALEDGLTVSFSQNSLLYSIDYGKNWKLLSVGESTQSINNGQMIYFKGGLTPSDNGIGTFSVNKNFNLKGSVMSLLFGDNTSVNSLMGYDYAFYRLFYNCTTLQSVSSGFLPAITLANYCYYDMFSNCASLTTAPELPATTLTKFCYRGMFSNCDSLTISPVLPATTLVNSCYSYMFQGCGNLCQITALFTTDPTFIPGPTLVYTTDWVSGVANTGIFYKNPAARWNTVGTYGVPRGWEVKTV